mmetsp:Transcript_8112/g.26631  ORF Transcript_8112/g.26631 Transcript_8112/m.26631 type:complete len:421 (+) Transcript_8112:258-1520(+)
MRKYRLVAKKGEGTFSEVLKAQGVKDGRYHAIKCMKSHFESIEQVNNLREIQALRRLSPHPHVIGLEEVLYDQPTGRLALVFELMEANLFEIIRGRRHYLQPRLVSSLLFQILLALDHMHGKGIFHRDIKPENILLERRAEGMHSLKLADFGSCRGIYSKQPYTEYISTRWYRAPECLLTGGYYGPEMDVWGAGCVFFEITSLYPLFPGMNELDQIHRIHKVLGTPRRAVQQRLKVQAATDVSFEFPHEAGDGISRLLKHAAAACLDLMLKMLSYDAIERVSAQEALQHSYFLEWRSLVTGISQSTTARDDAMKVLKPGTRIRMSSLAVRRMQPVPTPQQTSDRHYFSSNKRTTPALTLRREVRKQRVREQGPSVIKSSCLKPRSLPPITGIPVRTCSRGRMAAFLGHIAHDLHAKLPCR